MSDAIKCHWCGRAYAVITTGARSAVCCKTPGCFASGPEAATPALAVAAWERVAPKPVWTSEPPKEPGLYLVAAGEDAKRFPAVIRVLEGEERHTAEAYRGWHFAAIPDPTDIPQPVEPAPAGEE